MDTSPPAIMMELPNELVDCILDNLVFDIATLLSCALVERAWVQSSQRGIFRHIILELPSARHENFSTLVNSYLTGRLDALFIEKPHLASYVQSVQLRGFAGENQPEAFIPTCRQLGHPVAFAKTALTAVFRAPSLTQISLARFDISAFAELASLLSYSVHLKVLDASVVSEHWDVPNPLIVDIAAGTTSQPRSIHLHELMLSRHIHPLTIWFRKESCPFEVRNLQVLRLSGVEFSQMIDLVQYVGENLSELQIMSLQLGDLNNYFEHTPNLRILHLGNLWQTDSYIPVPIIQALFGRFSNQDSKFPIQHLAIVLRPQHIEPSETRH
ncbi:hypothetical protein BT96DRAFT_1025621 [Gymnopus androsaceus JB14]|uniref:F-box domain-containing protein n=1 Tax=Gymnopus androsaceus JB14 TaxID=1447944 RepID=A0A6A4GS39_9AGAR|nr:hypothetical protein BT96DRAFT_1025621 [Gymnopus androsaceus JB14]